MAGKRSATSQLNHDNWEEFEPEEAGTFQRAADDVIQNRVIKTARRKNPISQINDESNRKNAFSNFAGFSKTSTPTSSTFAFLSNMTNNAQFKSNEINSSDLSVQSNNSDITAKNMFSQNSSNSTDKKSEKPAEYFATLKGLNETVSQWIKRHVDKNPFCILSPVFKDYEKYLSEIESKLRNNKSDMVTETKSNTLNENKNIPTSIFGNSSGNAAGSSISFKPLKPEETKEVEKPKFSMGNTGFSFGNSPPAVTSASPFGTPSGFSFGSGKPFTFSNVSKPDSDEKKEEHEDEDEPPKAEFTPVVEDNNIFSKRCKVFVKKDGNFVDRGVGQLFLKPITDSEKVQLIVRADTNLGNLLLNFILSESIPTQRMGKNNVMLVCIPTPDSKPPPTPILLRVKTSEEADELLKTLEKHKK